MRQTKEFLQDSPGPPSKVEISRMIIECDVMLYCCYVVTIITKLLQCIIHNDIYIHVLKIKLSDPDNPSLLLVFNCMHKEIT